MPAEPPRVDYLLQHGGLTHPVSKHFLSALPRVRGGAAANPGLVGAETLFAPFFNLLDQYQTVISKQGSLAVATGHRSIARRILDRLEGIFSRELPPDGCECVVCEDTDGEHRGLSWGEVLEWVSGRIELPLWPPFDLAALGTQAAEKSSTDLPRRPSSPVNIDPDIAEEFRGHYLRQSIKVRSAVDKWLSNCAEAPGQDVDDETFVFAIITALHPDDRPYFNALMTGADTVDMVADLRSPTPMMLRRSAAAAAPAMPPPASASAATATTAAAAAAATTTTAASPAASVPATAGTSPSASAATAATSAGPVRPDFLARVGMSLQRLYKLAQPPRDAESAMYLLKYRHAHDLLVTVSDINPSEWEILTSGRFDGFLWSGADATDDPMMMHPFPESRGPTPTPTPGPPG
jgi:hypothetical protein